MLRIVRDLHQRTGLKNLCMAGGVALNCVSNGRIIREGPFENLWVQPAAGDAGGAIGAAFYVWNTLLGNKRDFVMEHAYWGSSFDENELRKELDLRNNEIKERNCFVKSFEDGELCKRVAEYIANGKVIGWFQGPMEWGPRALGN